MGRDSRSPKRDRHHRSSHRERSRERENTRHKKHRKSSRDRDEKRKHRDDYKPDSVSVKRYDTTQRGIDAAKNRLRASLGTAISELRDQDQKLCQSKSGSSHEYDFSDTMSVFSTLRRQKAIEQIEQPGFAPSKFTSGSSDTLANVSKNNKSGGDESSDMKIHERAIFGALWSSREIEQKLGQKSDSTARKADEKKEEDIEDCKPIDVHKPQPPTSIAHERLSADPAARQAKWLEIFRYRRRTLIEGH